MNPAKSDLLSDPLFQLNLLLWLAQPLPKKNSITPLLFQRGFSVYAIAPALGVPQDVVLDAQAAQVRVQASGRPDVILTHEQNRKFAFIECKAASFGPLAKAAEQAGAFLLMAGERTAEVLGLDASQVRDSILGYVVPLPQQAALETTLTTLTRKLSECGLPAGRATVLGLQATPQELAVSFDAAGSTFFSLSPGNHAVMKLEADTDPRPLYFIPYDPDIAQTPEERSWCKRVLFERIHSTILVDVGRASPPASLCCTPTTC